MSQNIKMEDLQEQVSASETETQEVVETEAQADVETEQDPLKSELERVQSKGKGRTELEQAQYKLKSVADQIKLLGGDPTATLGIEKVEQEEADEDDKPVTLGMWKKLQQEAANKTATQLAEEIENETERELTKYHLENSIKSTGNPKEDLKLARTLVNAVKNTRIIEEVARKTPAKTHSNSSGAPAKTVEVQAELTRDELAFMKPPFNLSKEAIIKARG